MQSHSKSSNGLVLAALGVVFGDIGTSPLYAFQLCLKAGFKLDESSILGVLSLIVWSLTIVVTLKYVSFVMRADNNREGGILALMALVSKAAPRNISYLLTLLGLFGAAMFYGDSMVTPAISVISAVEGLEVLNPHFTSLIVPVSVGILIALFLVQKRGTASIGKFFGPVMLVWFVVIGWLGVMQLLHHPAVLKALSPWYALSFAVQSPKTTFVVMASVFLALTGGEALYADMGHFGKAPVQRAWLLIAFPALVLNYLGQSALVLTNTAAVANPFFTMAPGWATAPLVILATAATVIASQAVVSGAFSMTKQGILLGYLPRLKVVHTSSKEIGQIYVPAVNLMLAVAVTFLVVIFKSSDSLAAAYGIAVSSTMMFTTVFMFVVTRYLWKWSTVASLAVTGSLMTLDGVFMFANLGKVLEGGWFPVAVGLTIFTVLTTWKRGRGVVMSRIKADSLPLKAFIEGLFADSHTRPAKVSGTAVFMSSVGGFTPTAFLHNLKHNRVLHDVNLFLTLETQPVPFVKNSERVTVEHVGHQCYAVTARLGFKETPKVPRLLELAQGQIDCWNYDENDTSFFLNRETIIAAGETPGLPVWREKLFAFLARNATKAADYFSLPTNRVVELGSQLTI